MESIVTLDDLKNANPIHRKPKFYQLKAFSAYITFSMLLAIITTGIFSPIAYLIGVETEAFIFGITSFVLASFACGLPMSKTVFTSGIGRIFGISHYSKRRIVWNRIWREHNEYCHYIHLMNKYEMGKTVIPTKLHEDMLTMASTPIGYRFLHLDENNKRCMIVEDEHGNELRINLKTDEESTNENN